MKDESENVGIFLDVENLTKWIKEDGPERLLNEINTIGYPVVRRAYGNWTSNGITGFQTYLNRLGFELIHTFHPVSGKNSADIQMTVDAIEYAWNLKGMSWFVLATGDSDFSPLFRRLREMGKGVIGVGPRSTLSETVKTSCSRFFYTESVTQKGDIAIQSAYEDAVDIAINVLSNFDGPIHLSTLKAKILNIDSAFNERQLGFSSFSSFIESIENCSLSKKSTMCEFQSQKKRISKNDDFKTISQNDLVDIYIKMLRGKNWRILPREDLINIFKQIKQDRLFTKDKLLDEILKNLGKDLTPTDVRKALAIFIKSSILKRCDKDSTNNECLWGVGDKPITATEMLMARDVAIVSRIMNACKEEKIPFDATVIQKLLYTSQPIDKIELIVQRALSNSNKTDDV